MAEINEAGFERSNLSDLIDNYKELFREAFGNEILLDDDSIFGQFARLFAERDERAEELAEAIYYAKTRSGAEGVELDDLYARIGIYRQDQQPGTGDAVVETNSTLVSGYTLSSTQIFSASNGITYSPTSDKVLEDDFLALKVEGSTVGSGVYNFTILDESDGNTYNEQFIIPTDGTVSDMFDVIVTLILDHTTGNDATNVFNDTGNNILYVGYNDTSFALEGIADTTSFTMNPQIGNAHYTVPVTANTNGYYELAAGGITALAPGFTGYVSATNLSPFAPGSEVESDAEFRIRADQVAGKDPVGTSGGITDALLDTNGISRAFIYDNASLNDRPFGPFVDDTPAMQFQTIIFGTATNSTVAQAIYDNKPINTRTFGDTSFTITASDGNTEDVKFTRATEVPVSIRVNYSTATGTTLTVSEQSEIIAGLQALFATINIGDTVFNSQLVTAVLKSVDFSRVTNATVDIKNEADPDINFANADFSVLFNEIATLKNIEVTFNQV